MTEREYINTTNLVRIRLAMNVLRDFLAMSSEEEARQVEAMRAMSKIEQRLTKIVKTTEEVVELEVIK